MNPVDASESRSGEARARPTNFPPDVSEAAVSCADQLTESKSQLQKPENATYAKFERA
jgi:hypothetical protein